MKKNYYDFTTWVIPASPNYYNADGAFNEFKVIPWHQTANFKINDIVYIYLSLPRQEIGYKCKVIEVEITKDNLTIDDSKYYLQEPRIYNKYMKLELLKKYDENTLSLNTMRNNGVSTCFQGPIKARGILAELLFNIDNM